MMQLRDYQRAAIDGLFNWWKGENANAPALVVLPTASGKTVVFSTLINELKQAHAGLRVLVLAHTQELIEQAAAKLLAVAPELVESVGIYAAALKKRDTKKPITIASRDSIANALSRFKPFDLIIIDECHLVNIKDEGRYRKIINWNLESQPQAAIVGFTATPYRQNGGFIYGDDLLFKGVAYTATIPDLMSRGYLAKITTKITTGEGKINTGDVKITAGDFNLAQLQKAASNRIFISEAIFDWERKAYKQGRRASCFFCVGVEHAKIVLSELKRRGINSEMITGDTPDNERASTLAAFDAGNLPALVNVACLTTGWDAPILDCIVSMRPTRSLALWLQIVGRGLRLFPGKENTLILDYGGNVERFGPIDCATPPPKKGTEKKVTRCLSCDELVSAFARSCPCCGAELKPDPVKICPFCGANNHPTNKACNACGELFLSSDLKTEAGQGIIIGGNADHRLHRIENITAFVMKSKRGIEYCRVTYWQNLESKYNQNLMIGLPGRLGSLAQETLKKLLPSENITTPGQAARLINQHKKEIIYGLFGVVIDHRSKYKDVLEIQTKFDASPFYR